VCCCLEDEISLGNAARRPSILRRGISRNCRETRGLVPFWERIDADRTTCSVYSGGVLLKRFVLESVGWVVNRHIGST